MRNFADKNKIIIIFECRTFCQKVWQAAKARCGKYSNLIIFGSISAKIIVAKIGKNWILLEIQKLGGVERQWVGNFKDVKRISKDIVMWLHSKWYQNFRDDSLSKSCFLKNLKHFLKKIIIIAWNKILKLSIKIFASEIMVEKKSRFFTTNTIIFSEVYNY